MYMRRAHHNTTRQVSTGDTIRAELSKFHRTVEAGRGDPFRHVDVIAALIGTRAAAMVAERSLQLKEEGAGPICDAQINMLIWVASDSTP